MPALPFFTNGTGPLLRLLTLAWPYRRAFFLGLTATLFSGGLRLVFPAVFGRWMDMSLLRAGAETGPLDRTVLLLLFLFALAALCSAAQIFLLSVVGLNVVANLRHALFRHLLSLSPQFFSEHRTGDLTSRLTADTSTVNTATGWVLAQFAAQAVTVLGSAVLLVVTNPRLSLLTLTVIPLVLVATRLLGRRIRRVSREVQDQVAASSSTAQEAFNAVRIVQGFTAEPREQARYGQGVQSSFTASLKRARLQAVLSGTTGFLIYSLLASLLWFGGREVMAGRLSPGDLVAFLMYGLQAGTSLGALSGLFGQFQEALGASGRIFELLDERSVLPKPTSPRPLSRARGEIRFQEVSFDYGDAPTLHNVSIEVPAGQVVALVGPSGAGKTTLANLIPRFWDVTGGSVQLDGHDVREYALGDLRAQIGLVPQETQLFSGTIEENIWYGRPNASREEVEMAARAAYAHGFISAFPQGYSTRVGERGVRLSGGQRQRVAIARALLKDAPVLILDEATSALDNESEALVQQALETLMRGRTTFVIAHRLSTIRRADRILVMNAGRIVEDGTHEELLAQGGLYRTLYELQFRREQLAEASTPPKLF